jgi:putative transposase
MRLVISDAHEGLRQAIAKVIPGATWQRFRAGLMRNLLSTVPKQAQDSVAALVRSIFSAPDHASAMTQLHEVAKMPR